MAINIESDSEEARSAVSRMAAGSVLLVAVLRDARKYALLGTRLIDDINIRPRA